MSTRSSNCELLDGRNASSSLLDEIERHLGVEDRWCLRATCRAIRARQPDGHLRFVRIRCVVFPLLNGEFVPTAMSPPIDANLLGTCDYCSRERSGKLCMSATSTEPHNAVLDAKNVCAECNVTLKRIGVTIVPFEHQHEDEVPWEFS